MLAKHLDEAAFIEPTQPTRSIPSTCSSGFRTKGSVQPTMEHVQVSTHAATRQSTRTVSAQARHRSG